MLACQARLLTAGSRLANQLTVASALCGLAGSGGWLLAARVLQAVGAALLFPQVISAILTIFPPELRGRAFGVFGVITIILALVCAPPMRSGGSHQLDPIGVALATGGLAGIVFGLVEGEHFGWGPIAPSSSPASCCWSCSCSGRAVGRASRSSPWPCSPSEASRSATGSAAGMMAIPLVMVLYLQTARGHSPLATGLTLLPGAVLTALATAYSGRLSDRSGGRHILPAGLATLTLGLLVLAATTGPHSTAWSLLPGLMIIGLGNGATYAPLQQVTMDGVSPRLAGAASGVANTIRQIGGVVGLAVLGALLSARLNATLQNDAIRQGAQLPAHLRDEFMTAIGDGARHFGPPSSPTGLGPGEAALFRRLGNEAFTTSFTGAMHTTLLATAAVLLAATAFCALLAKQRKGDQAVSKSKSQN